MTPDESFTDWFYSLVAGNPCWESPITRAQRMVKAGWKSGPLVGLPYGAGRATGRWYPAMPKEIVIDFLLKEVAR